MSAEEHSESQPSQGPDRPKEDRGDAGRGSPTKSRLRVALLVGAAALGTVALGAAAGYLVARRPVAAVSETGAEPASGATTWTCSMHPQIKLPKPGKCPICFMDLIPMAQEGPLEDQVKMSRAATALAGIQVTPVRRLAVTNLVRMVGKVDYDETRLVDSTAWIPGRLDRLYVDYTGVPVRKGDHLFHVYSPELVVAQEELLLAQRAYRQSSERTREQLKNNLKISEDKLRLWGLLDRQIEEIERRGTASDRVTIYAPVGGIVVKKHVNEGAYVKTGTPVYTIADLSQVWVNLDAYESDIPWLRYGQEVEFTTESSPGEVFKGRIAFIDPLLSEKTRSVKVRVNVPNAELRLKPGMFVRAVVQSRMTGGGRVLDASLAGKWICPMHPEVVKSQPGACDVCEMDLVRAEQLGFVAPERATDLPLVIPDTAPLRTGKRAVVYVQVDPRPLRAEEVYDWSALVGKLREQGQAAEPSPGRRTWELLPAGLRAALAELPQPPVPEQALRAELLDALNAFLQWPDFYDAASWERVGRVGKAASPQAEVAENLSAEDLLLRNRRLLEAAFPDEIAPAVVKPTFEGRQVVLGPRAGSYYIVRHGLAEGERVVTRGNFKIDSALQINARVSMMNPDPTGPAAKKLDVPASARLALNPVYAAYLDVSDHLAADDLAGARQSAQKLIQAVDAVDGRLLDDEARAQWKRLGNQVIVAAYATRDGRDLRDARLSMDTLSQAALGLVETFGHALDEPLRRMHCPMAFGGRGADWLQAGTATRNPYFGQGMPECGTPVATYESQAPLVVPEGFRRQLAGLYGAYFTLHEALADDRQADAVAAWKAIGPALQAVRIEGLAARAATKWQALRTELEQDLRADGSGAGIEGVRKQFEPLAATMLSLVETFGHAEGRPLAKVFCPMAFNNKGAPWLQTGTQKRNPYFGHSMLTCGNIQRTYASAGPQAAGAAAAKPTPAAKEVQP